MAQENVFKFVFVRPPEQAKLKPPVAPDPVTSSIRHSILEKMAQNIPNETARIQTAEAIQKSGQYFTKHELFSSLFLKKDMLASLLFGGQTNPKRDAFMNLFSEIYKGVTGEKPNPEKTRYKKLKETVWTSWFANYLHPDLTTRDAGELNFWVRIFVLYEQAADQNTFLFYLKEWSKLSPSMPIVFFQDTQKKDKTPGKNIPDSPATSVNDELQNLSEKRTVYRSAIRDVHELLEWQLTHPGKSSKARELKPSDGLKPFPVTAETHPFAVRQDVIVQSKYIMQIVQELKLNYSKLTMPELARIFEKILQQTEDRIFEIIYRELPEEIFENAF